MPRRMLGDANSYKLKSAKAIISAQTHSTTGTSVATIAKTTATIRRDFNVAATLPISTPREQTMPERMPRDASKRRMVGITRGMMMMMMPIGLRSRRRLMRERSRELRIRRIERSRELRSRRIERSRERKRRSKDKRRRRRKTRTIKPGR